MRLRVLTVFGCVVLFAVAAAEPPMHPAGVVWEDLGTTAPGHRIASVTGAPGAPSFRYQIRVDLSDEVPPIGDQGSQMSCPSWATAYYHRSQLEFRERHWDLTDPNHQFSPAFTHNQVNGGIDWDYVDRDMTLICEQGCASMADCPYNAMDYLTWPSERAYRNAIPFRCRDWCWFGFTDTTGLNSIRQLLCNGSTAVLGIYVWGNYDQIGQYGNIYCSADRSGVNRGAHGVCIVGYDDTLTTNDGPGAFRLTNSWGTGWGDSGFCWMSYVAVLDSLMCLRQTGFLTDTVGYEPSLLGRVQIGHPTRDRVGIEFRVGSAGSPLWSKEFRTWREAVQDRPFPNHKMVFDLTEGADYISGGQTDSVYVCCQDCHPDGLGGEIQQMSAQYLPWVTMYESEHPPVTIPDSSAPVLAGARVRHCQHDAGVSCILAPVGIVGPDSAYAPEVEVWNCGEFPATFPVRLTIGTGYADTVDVVNLASHDSAQVTFRDWIAPGRGTHLVRCSTALAGDEYGGNDVCTTSVRSRWHDVAMVEILEPADTVAITDTIRPKVSVRNNSTQTETFIATFRIPDEGYSRPAMATVGPGSVAQVLFTTWMPQNPGYHVLSCTLALDGDQVDTNNIITRGVFVTGIAETGPGPLVPVPEPTVVRGVLFLPRDMTELPGNSDRVPRPELLDACGRKVMELAPGRTDIRHLAPGIYFVCFGPSAAGRKPSAVQKVVVTR